MRYLYFWVEGEDDQRFVESVFIPHIAGYDAILVQKYASMKHAKVRAFLRSIKRSGQEVIFLADRDHAPCIQRRIDAVREKYSVPKEFPIVIVCREIEGWYLAGLADLGNRSLWSGSKNVDVNTIQKLKFNEGKPNRFVYRIDWMIELLKNHDRACARARSASFNRTCAMLHL